jgi:broad specificity phosphatase PhoE
VIATHDDVILYSIVEHRIRLQDSISARDTMTATLLFITHPEVVVDEATPVTRWSLSEVGRRRILAFTETGALDAAGAVFSSTEQKALDAAELLAQRIGQSVRSLAELGENDRSSTGYMEKARFEAAADAFFSRPAESFRGWETAEAAQRRIVRAVEQVLSEAPAGSDTVIVSHGAVGTLYKCHLKGIPISRSEDQSRQGNVYRVDKASRRLLHDWVPLPDV